LKGYFFKSVFLTLLYRLDVRERHTMNTDNLKVMVEEIIRRANELKDKHTHESDAPVNYTCIFSQDTQEYEDLLKTAHQLGKVIKETPTGPLFHIKNIQTVAGTLQLLKIRAPDPTRPERGDADFTIPDYPKFKKQYLKKKGFKLIQRETSEMIELMDPEFNVRAYFSNPPLDKQLGLK